MRKALVMVICGASLGGLPAGARAQEVLTEAEHGAALKYAQADGAVSSLEAQHSSSALAAAEQISGEKQPSGSALSMGVTQNAQAMASTPVDVVVLHGHFVASNVPTPAEQPLPEGSVLELVMNRLTNEPVAVHLGNSPTMTLMGNVQRESLKLPTTRGLLRLSVAKVARVRHRQRAHVANWGGGLCNATAYEHCYAKDEWYMEGGEAVEGSLFKVLLRQANVPPGGEAFVDEEEWVSNHEASHWAEAGLIAGASSGLWWFWAWIDGGSLTYYSGSPYTWPEPAGEFANFGLTAAGNNVWCLIIGPNYETQYWCMNPGFTYATRLQDGSEMATVTKPEVAGTAESNYEATKRAAAKLE
jgi:hypothetical protein